MSGEYIDMSTENPTTETAPNAEDDAELSGILADPPTESAEDAPADEVEAPEEAATAVIEKPSVAAEVKLPEAIAAEAPLTTNQKRLIEIESKMDDEYFDANSKDGKSLIKEHSRVAAAVEAEPLKEKLRESAVLEQMSDDTGLSVKELKSGWNEVLKALPAKYKNDNGAANFAFDQWIEKTKAAKAEPPVAVEGVVRPAIVPTKKPVIQPRSGTVSPPAGTSSHRPPTTPDDPGKVFDKSITRDDLNAI